MKEWLQRFRADLKDEISRQNLRAAGHWLCAENGATWVRGVGCVSPDAPAASTSAAPGRTDNP